MTASLSIDFETYSEAGYVWDATRNRWRSLVPNLPGLKGVGTVVYSEHPSTEVICLAYGDKLWAPGMQLPTDLFAHVAAGGLVTAWNSSFEYYIWKNVCVPMGWPELPYTQLRCSMAAARGWGLPGALDKAASALHTPVQKDKRGKQLITRLSIPRSPTIKDASLRRTAATHPTEHSEMGAYCLTDVQAESGIAAVTPPLSPFEQAVWLLDQKINYQGMAVDRAALDDCMAVVALATASGTDELQTLTGGAVGSVGEVAKMRDWLNAAPRQLDLPDLQKQTVADTLATRELSADCRRVLELRASLSASSVAKLNSLHHRTGADGRLHDLFAYCGAERTGRWAGRGPQPQNLPRGKWSAEGVEGALAAIASRDLALVTLLVGDPIAAVSSCLRGIFVAAPGHDLICSDYSAIEAVVLAALAGESWRMDVFRTHGKIYESSASKITGIPMAEFKQHYEQTGKHHPMRNKIGKVAELACFGAQTEVLTDSGWKRIVDVTTADKVHDGIDWVSHEGVVDRGDREVMVMGGVLVTPEHKFFSLREGWIKAREMGEGTYTYDAWDTASYLILMTDHDITGKRLPTDRIQPESDGSPIRVYDILNSGPRNRFVIRTSHGPLIAHNSGYQGGYRAWQQFGADEHMDEDELKRHVAAWREASPMIVKFWYGLERAAIQAVRCPGAVVGYRDVAYQYRDKVLYCKLLSGRELAYHEPELRPDITSWGAHVTKLSFMGWNAEIKQWCRIDTYGGKLTENVVQATARDILAHGMLALDRAGYEIVLHVHDEVVCEVPEGVGSVEQVEQIMSTMPAWCADWPVRATGGWRGRRYRKD